jgi:hypothetical protein
VHPIDIPSASLAGMSPLSKGGGGTASSDVQGSATSGEAPGPIGSQFQFSAPIFRTGSRRDEERQRYTKGPTCSKKRRTDVGFDASIDGGTLLYAMQDMIVEALSGLNGSTAVAGCSHEVQVLRAEMEKGLRKVELNLTQLATTAMARMQAEADRRVDAMIQSQEQMLASTPRPKISVTSPQLGKSSSQGRTANPANAKGEQTSWATNTESRTGKGWTTVTNGKKKVRKHPRGQRRVLFVRNVQSHDCDPRDIMFEVNKALAHARAHVTVRLTKMGYTEKGNLTGVMSENASAEELLDYAPTVMTAVKKLDPEVAYMEKTERWLKLRVHGVELDRYMSEGGLDVAREEIELMTGEQLPFAPRWIKGDTLAERFNSGSIKRSTLVLTVKSKKAADVIMAKGLTFGGRRHEVERFWERGEGGMCMRCCGRDHFGQCTGDPKCFVCAGDHEGSRHGCTVEGCSQRSGPCEHHAAKCANCKGPQPATSSRCPERRPNRQTRNQKRAEMCSSPPTMEPAAEEDGLTMDGDRIAMEITPAVRNQIIPTQAIPISSEMSTPEPVSQNEPSPRPTRELRPRTKLVTRVAQIFEPNDPTHMSIDDDSDTT